MTRILLISDTHGALSPVMSMLDLYPDVDWIFHLGDEIKDAVAIQRLSGQRVLCVAGNCDALGEQPSQRQFESDGVRLLLTHGHRYHVKTRLDALSLRAEELGAQAALYGHTHLQNSRRMGNVLLINPGAALNGDYALLTLSDGQLDYQLLRLSRSA